MPHSPHHNSVISFASFSAILASVPLCEGGLTLMNGMARGLISLFFGMTAFLSVIALRTQSRDPALSFLSSAFGLLALVRLITQFVELDPAFMSFPFMVSSLLLGTAIVLTVLSLTHGMRLLNQHTLEQADRLVSPLKKR